MMSPLATVGVVVAAALFTACAFILTVEWDTLMRKVGWGKRPTPPPEPKPKPRRYPAFGATHACPKCGADVAGVTRRHMESWDDGKYVQCMAFNCSKCGALLGEWPKDYRETPEEAAQREVDEAAP